MSGDGQASTRVAMRQLRLRLEIAEAANARVRDLARRLDDMVERSGFDSLDFLEAKTLAEAERAGYLDGVQTVVTGVMNALDDAALANQSAQDGLSRAGTTSVASGATGDTEGAQRGAQGIEGGKA